MGPRQCEYVCHPGRLDRIRPTTHTMELRNVRAFVAVADERHFGRAAASLNLTQPALSLRIQVLEKEVGIQLFQRNAREVRLAPAGEALLLNARALVVVEERALREMKDYGAG